MLKANRVMAVKKMFWLGAMIFATGFFVSAANAIQENTTQRQNVKARFSVNIDTMLNVTIPDRFAFDIRSDGILHYADFDVRVTTNHITGFNAYASVSDPNFVKSDDPTTVISSIAYDAPNNTVDFPLNHWGINFPSSDKPDLFVPATSEMKIEQIDEPVQDHAFKTVIGVRIDGETESGNYLCQIVYQVTANFVPDTIRSIKYLQQMSPSVATSMQEDTLYQLIDKRDDKTYWVTKHNGQIFMEQNLDLEFTDDIVESVPVYTVLTPENSDVADERTMTVVNPWGSANNELYYHSDGKIYYPDGYKTPVDATDLNPFSEDSRYMAGSHYSWSSATAGSGISVNAADTLATESICPSGWRLPLASEATLMATNAPLVRSGHFDSTTGNTIGIYDGANANSGALYLWTSSTGTTANDIKYILITPNSVSVEEGSRTDGFSVRCVADPPNEFTLYYDANGGTNAPAGFYDISWEDSASIALEFDSTHIPTLTGKDFLGWARTADATVPEFIAAGDEITLSPGEPTTVYAVWRTPCNPSATTISSAVCLQDVDSTVASTISSGVAYQLLDYRDGKTYFITKIGTDIWMTQNLDFNISASGTRLSPSTSDVTENRTITADVSSSIRYVDGGDYYYANGVTKTATTGLTDNDTAWHYHVGSYYSWDAAAAGVGATAGYSTESICPKGWTLPTAAKLTAMMANEHVAANTTNSEDIADGSDGDLTFKSDLDLSTLFGGPYYISLAGYNTEYGRTIMPGASVRLWASDEVSEDKANTVYLYHTTNSNEQIIQVLDDQSKNSQYIVRCVLK